MTALAPRDAYRVLARDYGSAPNPLLVLEQRVMRPLLPRLDGATIADIAAGTGRWADDCAARGARAVAIDFCAEMLCQSHSHRVCADASSLPLPDESCDLTLCTFALGYAPWCFAELVRITRPGGVLLVSDLHPSAIARGWRRRFRVSGHTIEVRDHVYSISDLRHDAIEQTHLLEPSVGEPERPFYVEAGREDLFEDASRNPAIFVARWIRR